MAKTVPDLSKKIEAILFSVGNRISIEEISKLTRERDLDRITEELVELQKRFEKSDGPVVIHREGNFWKMNVTEEHMPTVRKVVKKMELPKTLLETLAAIAWKAPVKQSIIINIRTNKAYDHLDQLEEMGYISRKKYGRTKLISLAQKFYDYFEINEKGGLGKIFKRVTDRAKKKYPESTVAAEDQSTVEEAPQKKMTPAEKELEKLHKKGLIKSARESEEESDQDDVQSNEVQTGESQSDENQPNEIQSENGQIGDEQPDVEQSEDEYRSDEQVEEGRQEVSQSEDDQSEEKFLDDESEQSDTPEENKTE